MQDAPKTLKTSPRTLLLDEVAYKPHRSRTSLSIFAIQSPSKGHKDVIKDFTGLKATSEACEAAWGLQNPSLWEDTLLQRRPWRPTKGLWPCPRGHRGFREGNDPHIYGGLASPGHTYTGRVGTDTYLSMCNMEIVNTLKTLLYRIFWGYSR